ncbi:MAG: hypothetical protein HOW97_14280 [Catenulispora sp.]|nr:hypothetical protein [Catenulispora sp.]
METCHRCGTVLPAAPGARYCPNCGEMYAAASDPTQAFAAVGHGTGGTAGGPGGTGYPGRIADDTGMTWDLPPEHDPTQAIPAQPGPTQPFAAPAPTQAFAAPGPTQPFAAPGPVQAVSPQGSPSFGPAPVEPDHYAELFRPEGGAANNPNATQVMAPVAAGEAAYGQPAYDQPIDYQTGAGGAYSEPYDGPYADDYDAEAAPRPRSSRSAMIGIGVAAGAVLVIVISLITLGGGSSTPTAAPGSSATEVVTPTSPVSTAPATGQQTTAATTAPATTAPSTAPHPPGTLALGVTGGEVKWLQARLKQLHLYNGEINGTFDAATQAAVVAFQNRTHPADQPGVVGRSTKTALIAAGSKPALSLLTPGTEKHGKGANPADIKRLQQALSAALNTPVKATGQFDVDTFGAVVQYQSAVGLSPDGIAGDKVWSALQQGKITG